MTPSHVFSNRSAVLHLIKTSSKLLGTAPNRFQDTKRLPHLIPLKLLGSFSTDRPLAKPPVCTHSAACPCSAAFLGSARIFEPGTQTHPHALGIIRISLVRAHSPARILPPCRPSPKSVVNFRFFFVVVSIAHPARSLNRMSRHLPMPSLMSASLRHDPCCSTSVPRIQPRHQHSCLDTFVPTHLDIRPFRDVTVSN